MLMRRFHLLFIVIALFLSSCTKKTAQTDAGINRIVCLSPSGAEILFAIGAGDRICARTDFCDYPEKLLEVPSVGGFDGKSLSLETIYGYKPQFVYGAKGMHDFIVEPLNKLGVDVYLAESKNIEDVIQEIEFMGTVTGNTAEAKECIEGLRRELNSVTIKGDRVKVYYEVWYAPFMSVGKNSYINSIIEAAGGKNIFETLDDPYPMVSEESVIASNPDVIIVPDQNGITVDAIKSRKGWQNMEAVKNNRIYIVDGNIVSRPGPRIIEAVKKINEKL